MITCIEFSGKDYEVLLAYDGEQNILTVYSICSNTIHYDSTEVPFVVLMLKLKKEKKKKRGKILLIYLTFVNYANVLQH